MILHKRMASKRGNETSFMELSLSRKKHSLIVKNQDTTKQHRDKEKV